MRNASIMIIAVWMILLPVAVSGFESKESRESLRGIRDFHVTIKYIPGSPERGGLRNTDQLTEEIRQKLVKAGINVLTVGKYGSDADLPRIDLKTFISKAPNGKDYICCIRLKVIQRARLIDSSKEANVVTWSSDYSGVRQTLDMVTFDIRYMIDVFVNGWLAVNPPE